MPLYQKTGVFIMRKIILFAFIAFTTHAANAQKDSVTVNDYTRAASTLNTNVAQYVDNNVTNVHWTGDDQFWYQTYTPSGSDYIQIDALKGTRTKLADHSGLAAAARPKVKSTEVLSPDGKKAAFIKEYNLWVRDLATDQQTQLTTDGVQYYGYATDNAGWKHSDKAILQWSPDSKKIASFQQDERKAGNMYLVTTNVGHPTLQQWKYPLPGDSNIIMIERVIINVDEPKVIRLQVPADPHRASLSDDISSSGTFDDVCWSEDGTQLAFVSTSRDHKIEKMRIADAATGSVKEIFEERVATQYESGQDAVNWKYLPKTKEIIWYSERDNWGHLYLYDAVTGKLKNQITKGDWVVTQMLHIDESKRTIYFLAGGKEPGNPYFAHLYKTGFDGKNLVSLTPEAGNHRIIFSPSMKYFIDDYSQPDVPNVVVLRNMDGKIITTLEKTDISRLKATGWQPAKPIIVKAHDGTTDLYGLMFTPSKFDSTKKYPVVVYIYPGPQGGSIGNWSFGAARGDNQAVAELGFVVVAIEGTSNPLRSKSYHDMSYGFMAENTLPDQIGGVRQLAASHNYIDTNRVGIWGHSGGGFATACAMFKFPDFFKVGIAESGNHDNRNYEDDWGERYIGLLTKDASGKDNYEAQANQVYAGNLKGKLLLAHGMMDDNVPPYNTMLVVEALEKANKDYDLVVFPNSRHGYGTYSSYMMRRRWDYFVTNLLGADHPKEFDIKLKADPRKAAY